MCSFYRNPLFGGDDALIEDSGEINVGTVQQRPSNRRHRSRSVGRQSMPRMADSNPLQQQPSSGYYPTEESRPTSARRQTHSRSLVSTPYQHQQRHYRLFIKNSEILFVLVLVHTSRHICNKIFRQGSLKSLHALELFHAVVLVPLY